MVYIPALYVPMHFICRHRVGIMCRPLRMSCAAVHLVFWPFECPGRHPSFFSNPSGPPLGRSAGGAGGS
jgi:hypothetical protein